MLCIHSLTISNMGKKHIIRKTEEEILKEKADVDKALKKEIKVKGTLRIKEGRVYITSSYNNTKMSLTNDSGDVLAWRSAGSIGFKNTKKATPFAASKVAEALAQAANKMGIREVSVVVKGIGSGRESALRSLSNKGLNIISIEDATPIPHNGCRPPKSRRV